MIRSHIALAEEPTLIPYDLCVNKFQRMSTIYDVIIQEGVDVTMPGEYAQTPHRITYTKPRAGKIMATDKVVNKNVDPVDELPLLAFPDGLAAAVSEPAHYIQLRPLNNMAINGYLKNPYTVLPIIQYVEDVVLGTANHDHNVYLLVIKGHQPLINAAFNRRQGCKNPISHDKFIPTIEFLAEHKLVYQVYTLKKNTLVYLSNRLYFLTLNTDRCLETRQTVIWNTTYLTCIISCTCSSVINRRRCIYCNMVIFKDMEEHIQSHERCLICSVITPSLVSHLRSHDPINKHVTSGTVVKSTKKTIKSEPAEVVTTIYSSSSSKKDTRVAESVLSSRSPTPEAPPMTSIEHEVSSTSLPPVQKIVYKKKDNRVHPYKGKGAARKNVSMWTKETRMLKICINICN